jgi:hypothetical protein
MGLQKGALSVGAVRDSAPAKTQAGLELLQLLAGGFEALAGILVFAIGGCDCLGDGALPQRLVGVESLREREHRDVEAMTRMAPMNAVMVRILRLYQPDTRSMWSSYQLPTLSLNVSTLPAAALASSPSWPFRALLSRRFMPLMMSCMRGSMRPFPGVTWRMIAATTDRPGM